MTQGMAGRTIRIAVLSDGENRPNIFRFESTGPNDADFTYDDAQHVQLQLPFEVEVIRFAVGKTGYAILAPALKELVVIGDPQPTGEILLRTHLGPEFRLGGEMAKQVLAFIKEKGLIFQPLINPSIN